ncbi:hypothetical protein [Methylibium sp.]|uniref:hypothetical protein n=1 Tax=Methylibium sp. TaxID=2067992 RepID=UPI003D0AC26A
MKFLIAEACTIAGEQVSRHAEVNEEVDIPKDDALLLARMGRGYLLNKEDAPKGQESLVATSDDRAQIKKRAAGIKAEREARAEAEQLQTPTGLAALVAASVAQAVQGALQPAVKA